MLFLNISSDKIFVSDGTEKFEFSNMGLEKSFPIFLKDLYDKNFYDKIFLINGPGSFTTLRITTLCVNMLNFIFKDKIDIFSISKIDLYKYFYNKGFLPSIGYVFIGQKKNVWKYDFTKNSYEICSIENILGDNYFIDKIYGDYGFEKQKMIDIEAISDGVLIEYLGNSLKISIEELNLKSYKSVAPDYMIQPNIN